MRLNIPFVVLPVSLLMLGACDVDNDPASEKVTVTYDRERIKQGAQKAGRAAKTVATGAANVAESTGKAIKKEVGDVDVDVKVTRDRTPPTPAQ